MFWFEDEAPKAGRTRRVGPRPARPDAANPRWKHTCGWDGHELAGMDYVQVSTHERVCRFHHPQFVDWIEESSKRMYRLDPDPDM